MGLEERLSKRLAEARALALDERFEEALQAYMDVFEDSRPSAGFAGVRLSYVLGETAAIGNRYAPARSKLFEMRNEKEKQIISGDNSLSVLHEWSALNQAIDQKRPIQFYDELKSADSENSKILKEIRNLIWQQLVAAKRYSEFTKEEVSTQISNLATFTTMHSTQDFMRMTLSDDQRNLLMEFARRKLLEDGCSLFECALALNLNDMAGEICKLVLDQEKTDDGYARLIRAATNASAITRARELVTEAKANLRADNLIKVSSAEQQIPR